MAAHLGIVWEFWLSVLLGSRGVRGEEGKGNGSGRVGWVLGRVGWVMVNWVGLENKRIGCWD